MTGAQRLAMRLIRLYPRAWRERYQSEMVDLIEREDFLWSDAIDIARAAAREQVRRFLGASNELQALRWAAIRDGVTFAGIGAALSLAALPVGAWLNAAGWEPSRSFEMWAYLGVALAPLRGVLIQCLLATESDGRAAGSFTTTFAVRRTEAIGWAVLVFATAIVMRAADLTSGHRFPDADDAFIQPLAMILVSGIAPMQMVAMGTSKAIQRARRCRDLRAERRRAEQAPAPDGRP